MTQNIDRNLLERWQLTQEELSEFISQNPSMRGLLLGLGILVLITLAGCGRDDGPVYGIDGGTTTGGVANETTTQSNENRVRITHAEQQELRKSQGEAIDKQDRITQLKREIVELKEIDHHDEEMFKIYREKCELLPTLAKNAVRGDFTGLRESERKCVKEEYKAPTYSEEVSEEIDRKVIELFSLLCNIEEARLEGVFPLSEEDMLAVGEGSSEELSPEEFLCIISSAWSPAPE